MKLTASGVANCAAIVRSPSFSRSSSSTTTTKRPARMSSIASSTVAKRALGVGLGLHRHGRIANPGSSRSTYFARTSTSRLTSSPGRELAKRRRLERVRDQRDLEAVSSTASDGQRDAVDRDRSLLDAVAEQLVGAARSDTREPSPSSLDERTRPTPSTWPCTMVAAERISRPERRLDVDASPATSCRARRANVSGTASKRGDPRRSLTTVRQTPSIATESPISSGAVAGASIRGGCRRRRRRRRRPLPTSRTIPVNMVRGYPRRLAQVRLERARPRRPS